MYGDHAIERDQQCLNVRYQPVRGFKVRRCAQTVCAGHIFVRNLREGFNRIGVVRRDPRIPHAPRLMLASDEITQLLQAGQPLGARSRTYPTAPTVVLAVAPARVAARPGRCWAFRPPASCQPAAMCSLVHVLWSPTPRRLRLRARTQMVALGAIYRLVSGGIDSDGTGWQHTRGGEAGRRSVQGGCAGQDSILPVRNHPSGEERR